MTILQLFGAGAGLLLREMLRSRSRDRLPSDAPFARYPRDRERDRSSSNGVRERPREALRRAGDSIALEEDT